MKKLLILILAVSMLATVCFFAASCEKGGTTQTTTTTTTVKDGTTTTEKPGETTSTSKTSGGDDTTTTTTTDTEPSGGDDFDSWNGKTKMPGMSVDFGDKIFLIASTKDDEYWDNTKEIWVESLTNDAINDAVYERNEILHNNYNCTIMVDDGGWDNGFNADVAAGGGKYIAGSAEYLDGANGNFYNVRNLDIDFTQSWWDQAFVRDMTVNGKMYMLCGDFALKAMEATWIMFYNKDVYDNNFADSGVDIYQLVRDKKWTVEALLTMCQKVKSDNNGDQQLTYSTGADADMLGMVTTAHNIRGLFYACGETYTKKDDNGKLISAIESGKGSDAIDKIRTLTTDESYAEIGYTSVQAAIENSTALFAGEVMNVLGRMAGNETLRVGVLPQPLYDENQAEYCHYVNNRASFYFVPTSYANMKEIADFFTLYAAHSSKIVRTAYVNTYKFTYASDEESAEMVDIILNTRTYDLGYHRGFALAFDGVLPSMCGKTGKNQFGSAAKRYSSSITDAIATYEEKIAAIDDPV